MNNGSIATLTRVALWAGLLLCLGAPKPAAGLGAPGFSAMINFQTNRSTSISNYLIDVGDAYPHTQNNCSYGWNVDNTANAFDRGTVSPDRRLDTGIRMQAGTNSYYWQIQVPNGIYDVQILAGDPTDTDATLSGTRYNINVGTTPAVVDGRPGSGAWCFGTNHIQVAVTNRLLGVSNGTNAVNNKILCISIQQVAPIFWGALVADNPTNWPYYSKAPADYFGESKPGVLGYFESHTGKKISLLLYGLGGFGLPYTNTQGAAGMWARGTIPFWDSDIGSSQSISNVVEGYCDTSITNLALRFKNYGKPMFFCFCREMNGNWYAWSEINKANTNAHRLNPTRYSFTNMWVYVHDKFTSLGCTNVTWVWTVDQVSTDAWHQNPVTSLYPGDQYVDWLGMDIYNVNNSPGQWFVDRYSPTYQYLTANFPNKPILIKEIGTDPTLSATPKPAWISDFLHQLPSAFPNIRAFTWFDWNANSTNHNSNWPIEGGDNYIAYTNNPPIDWASVAAFSNGIASPFYLSNIFVNQTNITLAPSAASTVPTIQPILLLPAPTGLRALATNGGVVLTWNAVVGATNYNIYRSANPTNGPLSWRAATTTTSYTDTTAASGATWFYTVTAQNLAGESVDSALASSAAPPDPNLALWLKLDESAGAIAADSSGYGNYGALSGGTLWRPTSGLRAGALQFNGNNTQVVVADASTLDNTSAFTLAYWFWSAAFAVQTGGLVSKRDGLDVNEAFATYLNRADQHIYVDINGSSSRFASRALIRNGAWYHVAVVFDGALPPAQRSQLWINGQLDTVAPQSATVLSNYPSNLRLGNTDAGAANWFTGSMDDVRFYRRALRPEEIAALATVSLVPTNLTAVLRGDLLDLSWPADHLGWQLQVQTNSNLIGLGTNWTTLPASLSTNRLSLPIDPANGTAFYRLSLECP